MVFLFRVFCSYNFKFIITKESMRAALEKLTCRTKHDWSDWGAPDEDKNVTRYCLRKSCDKEEKRSYGEVVMFRQMMKHYKRFIMHESAFDNIFSSSDKSKTIKWRRYV